MTARLRIIATHARTDLTCLVSPRRRPWLKSFLSERVISAHSRNNIRSIVSYVFFTSTQYQSELDTLLTCGDCLLKIDFLRLFVKCLPCACLCDQTDLTSTKSACRRPLSVVQLVSRGALFAWKNSCVLGSFKGSTDSPLTLFWKMTSETVLRICRCWN